MPYVLPPQEIGYQLSHITENRSPEVTGVSIAFFGAAAVAVALRLLARRLTSAGCKKDDYLIIIALVFASGLMIENLIAAHYGLGKHLVRVGVDGLVKDLQNAFAFELTYILCHLTLKLSVLMLYARLFTLRQRRLRLAIYGTGIYVIVWAIYTFFVVLFQCRPIHCSWDLPRGLIQRECVDLLGAYVGTGITNTISDVVVTVLPMPIVWGLQTPRRQKMIISGIFFLGAFACGSSVARIVFLVRSTTGPVDTTYDTAIPLVWSIIEPCVGIICACLPTLRPIFQSFFVQLSTLSQKFTSSHSSTSPTSSDTLILEKHHHSSGKASLSTFSHSPSAFSASTPLDLNGPPMEWSRLNERSLDGVRHNNASLWEQIRRSHGSWLFPGSEEDLPKVLRKPRFDEEWNVAGEVGIAR